MSLSSRSGPSTAVRLRPESDRRMNAAILSVDELLRRRLHVGQRRETLGVCQRPLLRIVCMTDTGEELAILQECVNLREALDLARRDSFEDVHGPKMARVSQSSRPHQFAQGGERALVKLAHASGLVVDHEGPLAPRILRRDAGWATVGMTGLRLDAAQGEHEATGCKRAMSKPVTTRPLARRRAVCRSPAPTRQLWASTKPSRSGVPTWSTNSSGAAPVPPSDPSITMKSGRIPVSSMALQSAMNSQAWPMQSLKPTRLPPDKP